MIDEFEGVDVMEMEEKHSKTMMRTTSSSTPAVNRGSEGWRPGHLSNKQAAETDDRHPPGVSG